MSTVEIKIDGTDYTDKIVYATAEFISAVNGTTGSCKFRVRDDDRTLTFVTGVSIELLVDSAPVWTGFLTQQLRVYAFPAENVADAGLTRWLDIVGVDLNILFVKRFVFTKASPTIVFGKLYGPNQPDNTAIADLVADYLDLSGDGLDTSTKVEFVGDINVDQDARAWLGGDSFGQAMTSIASLPGAVFFIDPARFLVYTDANTADAPNGLSDQPSTGGTITYFDDSFTGTNPTFWDGWVDDGSSGLGGGSRSISEGGGIGTMVMSVVDDGGGGYSYEEPAVRAPVSMTGLTAWRATTWISASIPGVALSVFGLGLDNYDWGWDVSINSDGSYNIDLYTASTSFVNVDQAAWDTSPQVIEMLHTVAGATELRIWPVSGSRPSSPLLSVDDATPMGSHDLVSFYAFLYAFPNNVAGSFTIGVDRITIDAPPVGSSVGYREMVITKDGTSLANDVLAWGLGYGSTAPVFDRAQDATSESLHGLWQAATVRNGIYKQATIDRVAESILDGSPENLRGAKDDKVGVRVVTYAPGFLPAQKVDFTSAVFGFEDVIPIRKMRVTFDTPDTPRYELDISHNIDEPWGFIDQFLLTIPGFRPPPLPIISPPPIIGFQCAVLDDFEREVNPGFGVVTPSGAFAYDPPVYSTSGTSTALAHVTSGDGRFDLTVQATEPNGANHADASVSLPGPISDPNEFRLTGHATLIHNFPAFTSPTSVATADMTWVLTIQDDPTYGSYFMQLSVELTKDSPSGGPVAYQFHVVAQDFSGGGGGVVISVLTSEQFVTALEFDWVIDRSASRGTIEISMSHINGGLPYSAAITAGPAPVMPVAIKVEGDAQLQNHISVDWSPRITNDNWVLCQATGFVYGGCWVNSSGLFDNFNRPLVTPDPPSPIANIGCTTFGNYTWLDDGFDATLDTVLNGGLQTTLPGPDYDPVTGHGNSAGDAAHHVFVPLDAASLRVTLNLYLSMNAYDPFSIGGGQSVSEFDFSVWRMDDGGDFDPSTASRIQEYDVSIYIKQSRSIDGGIPHLYVDFLNHATHDMGAVGSISSFVSVTEGVIFEVDGNNVSIAVGAYTDSETVTIVPATPGDAYAKLIFDTNSLNGEQYVGQTAPNSGFVQRISDLKVTSSMGTCVPVPPRAVTHSDYNGSCTALAAFPPSSGALGSSCVTPTRLSDTMFTTPQAFAPGSTMVWAGGLFQRRGIDYLEGADYASIVFTSSVVEMTPIRVCYQLAVVV